MWVDPEGGPAAWAEPGFALLLPAGEADAAAVRAGAMRLARRHGQAAVYVIQGVAGGGGGVGRGFTPVHFSARLSTFCGTGGAFRGCSGGV
jgi:hypothetical protein